ncbi:MULTISPECIES: MarR family winged helix-turn-helix transcriptional regulator [unclassified Janthinobacterium]|uniref:MarR family winged helix-turn-helix transcriptional regulator n=1 Tax=unclassified Janthinobacterium TaxID=2610881 RepID=UPI00037BB6D6|nr:MULTISPECIES: MarR family transcriptional regulator [unclassified Janthinobacterium]MEC5159205.1 DNA-binding MarR family transcriptional regulator [Janthinobacterium sp. CG_S6]
MTATHTTPQTQAADGALDFCLRLARAQAVLVRRLDNTLGNLHGISFSDFQLLYHLNRAPGARLRRVDVAERLALTASGVTRALLPLEKIGLVSRQPDPRDARVGYAAITEAGQTLLQHAVTTAHMISQELLKDTAPEQLDVLAAILGQIAGMNLANT